MARHPVGPYPAICVSHHVRTRYWVVAAVANYALSPIAIPRPDEGQAFGEVPCNVCGGVLQIRVFDADRTRRLRRLWIALAALCAAAFVGAILLPYGPALHAAGIVIGVCGIYFCGKWMFEDGVRLDTRSPGHGLEFPKVRKKQRRVK